MDGERNRPGTWKFLQQNIGSQKFDCGYCGHRVSSDVGWNAASNGAVRICPECQFPTFIGTGPDGKSRMVVPASLPGRDVENVPEPIRTLYAEARQSAGVGAHTACVLTCRKMLVDLACENGDTWKRGKEFWKYVEYLNRRLFAPDAGQVWINRIKDQGNKATHELGIQTEAHSVQLLRYVEILLRLLYEIPQAPDDEAPETNGPPLRGNEGGPKPAHATGQP